MTTKFAAARLLTIRSATIDAIVAILTVDVVGYSRLMGADEAGDGQPH
jgi:class 3 adenylate cyclase